MLLKNFINYLSLTKHDSDNMVKNCAGNMQKLYLQTSSINIGSIPCNIYNTTGGSYIFLSDVGIVLGSGTTAPTFNDYKIEAPITTLTAGGNSTTRGSGYDTYSTSIFTQTVVNNTASPITVNEIGLFTRNSNDSGCSVLFTRDIISPVTIGVGERKTFVVTIDLAEMSTSASAS